MKTLAFNLFVFFISIVSLQAQISYGGYPKSWNQDVPAPGEFVSNGLLFEGKADFAAQTNGAFKFAEVIAVNKGTANSGTWTTTPDGDKIWRLKLTSKGAYSINFTFSIFNIPQGAQVFVYSEQNDDLLGAFTHKNKKSSGVLPIVPIAGESIIIEYNEPANAAFKGELFVSQLGHDFTGAFSGDMNIKKEPGDCNVDVNCGEGQDWQIEKNAICKIIIDNQELCTGTLVNNELQDKKPYLLTANHCISTQELADKSNFIFNYENSYCGGGVSSEIQSISGAILLATKNNDETPGYLDFTLVELSGPIPDSYKPYFAGWDARGEVPESSTGLHHPQGSVMKISKDLDPPSIETYVGLEFDEDTFWKVAEWDVGVTEGGSSGSAIFDENHRVVGTLTGGSAYCGFPKDDFYQMFSASYDSYDTDSTQLKNYLDPNNEGIAFMNGFDPYNRAVNTEVEAIFHWDPNEDMAIATTDNGGFVSGNNEFFDLAKAEYFTLNEFGGREVVLGGYAYFCKAVLAQDQAIEFFLYTESNGAPAQKIASTSLPLSLIVTETDNNNPVYFKFNNPVDIVGNLFIGVTLPQTEGDTLALFNTVAYPTNNYAWEQSSSETWLPYSDDASWTNNWINYLAVHAASLTAEKQSPIIENNVVLYPNPASSEFTLSGLDLTKNNLKIYNVFGKQVYNQKNYQNKQSINCSHWKSGLYLIVIEGDGKRIVKKALINP